MIKQQSLYIADDKHQLHVRHIVDDAKPQGEPVLMVHGAIENGRIFYNEKGRGLGCFLAEHGYDVYIIDLRGRGDTKPRIQPFDAYGQTETIVHDIPLFMNFVHKLNPQPMHLMAHSWGGVLLSSTLARFPELIDRVRSQVYFGTKRRVAAFNMEVLVKIKFMWRFLAPKIAKRKGYLPAEKMNFGSDDETMKSHYQSMRWTKTPSWIDEDDDFDYRAACQNITWPATWFIAAVADKALGHPDDVQRFMVEANYVDADYSLLSKAAGNQKDYDHISMLTDKAAVEDHFVEVLKWLDSAS